MDKMLKTKPAEHIFDWNTIHQRMAQVKTGLVMDSKPPLEALESVWAERAGQLAKPPDQEQKGKQIDLVFIKLCNEIYALDVSYVYDIRPLAQTTPVPHVPDWVRGVYNLRGHILCVTDLTRFLGLPKPEQEKEESGTKSLVVVKTTEMETALLVDHVVAVDMIPASQIQVPSELVRGLPPDYVRGIVDLHSDQGEHTAVILNLQAILADENLVVNQEIV